jgi:hypothetical protein
MEIEYALGCRFDFIDIGSTEYIMQMFSTTAGQYKPINLNERFQRIEEYVIRFAVMFYISGFDEFFINEFSKLQAY